MVYVYVYDRYDIQSHLPMSERVVMVSLRYLLGNLFCRGVRYYGLAISFKCYSHQNISLCIGG